MPCRTSLRGKRPAAASTTLARLTGAWRRRIDVQSVKSEQGQTLVEFALVLPLLLILVIGIFDFGSAFNSKNDLNFIANTAARYAEVNSCTSCTPANTTPKCAQANPSPMAAYVCSTAVGLSGTPKIRFTLPSGSNGGVGDPLQVTACVPFSWLGGATLPRIPTGSITGGLTSTVTVRILQASDGSLYTVSGPASC